MIRYYIYTVPVPCLLVQLTTAPPPPTPNAKATITLLTVQRDINMTMQLRTLGSRAPRVEEARGSDSSSPADMADILTVPPAWFCCCRFRQDTGTRWIYSQTLDSSSPLDIHNCWDFLLVHWRCHRNNLRKELEI